MVNRTNSAAIYFPRVLAADPLKEFRQETFAPSGAVAGVIARTDTDRGVWKAPAGLEATLVGVTALSLGGEPGLLTDPQIGLLNPFGVNCLRTVPNTGHVVWGARTLDGARLPGVGMEISPGAAHRPVHRREPVPWHAMGGVRTERRAAVTPTSVASTPAGAFQTPCCGRCAR